MEVRILAQGRGWSLRCESTLDGGIYIIADDNVSGRTTFRRSELGSALALFVDILNEYQSSDWHEFSNNFGS